MDLDVATWVRIDAALPRLYRELEPVAHGRAMLELIQDFVPASSLFINRLDTRSGIYEVQDWPEGLSTTEQIEETGRYLDQSPFPAYHLATGDPMWKMTTDFMPLEDFRETDLYRVMRCWQVEVQMCALLTIHEGTAHALTVHRTLGGFSEREREILNVLHPHFITSYINALAFQGAGRSLRKLEMALDGAPGAYGYFEKDGRVGWLQPRAREWLGQSGGGFTDDLIPSSIRGLLTRAVDGGGETVHAEIDQGDEWLGVTICPSPMGGWILRLEKRPKTVPFHFRALPGFTARENQVLEWMVQGKRNSEIAVILGISPRTVEKHVGVILERFGVENRAAVVVRAMELVGGMR